MPTNRKMVLLTGTMLPLIGLHQQGRLLWRHYGIIYGMGQKQGWRISPDMRRQRPAESPLLQMIMSKAYPAGTASGERRGHTDDRIKQHQQGRRDHNPLQSRQPQQMPSRRKSQKSHPLRINVPANLAGP